jgi:hypothetical protein
MGAPLDTTWDTKYLLTCVCYIVILFFLWYFVKINFILNPHVNHKLKHHEPDIPLSNDLLSNDLLSNDTVDTQRAGFTNPTGYAPGGASGWYSKGQPVPLKDSDGSEFGDNPPVMVKESIWGTAANWGDAEKYPTRPSKTSSLGYNYANHSDMYSDTSDITHTPASFASDSEFSGASSQVVDRAGRDGYSGGRGVSHREGLDNPDGDIDGDFGMYDIYATRTNTPSQPLTASQSAGRMADASGKISIKSGPSYGMYGDLPVALYNTADTATGDEWGLGSDKLYRVNSYTWNEDKNY